MTLSLRRALIPALAGGLLLPLAAPAAAEPGPLGAEVRLVTFGLAFGNFTYPLAQGKRMTVERHVLDPGEVVRWTGPSTTVAINQTGKLTHFPSCTQMQSWRAFPAYYVVHAKQHGTLTGVTVNTSDAPVELITLVSEAIGAPQRDDQLHRHEDGLPVDPVVAADGCPDGPAAASETLAGGIAAQDAAIDLIDHNQIAVYRHTVAPGYRSGWHSPAAPTFVLPISGTLVTYTDCEQSVSQQPGTVHLTERPQRVTNPGSAPAEVLTIAWNIPNGFPVDAPLFVPEAPPAGCLT